MEGAQLKRRDVSLSSLPAGGLVETNTGEPAYYHHKGAEIVQMMRDLADMPGKHVIDELTSLEISIYIYARNHQEATKFFDFVKNDPANQDLWHQQSLVKQRGFHRETSRLLQNHVAAVQALVEHMKRIHERLYGGDGRMPEYATRAQEFHADPLVSFVRSLRNILLHNETAATMLRVSISDEWCTNQLGLPVEFLKKHRNWLKGSSKQYLKDQDEFVDIPALLEEHNEKVSGLVNWFHRQIQFASFDEIQEYAAAEEKLFRVQIEDQLDSWFFNPDPVANMAPGDFGLFHGLLDRKEFDELATFAEGSEERALKAIELADRHIPLSEAIKTKIMRAYSDPYFFRVDAFHARTIDDVDEPESENEPS